MFQQRRWVGVVVLVLVVVGAAACSTVECPEGTEQNGRCIDFDPIGQAGEDGSVAGAAGGTEPTAAVGGITAGTSATAGQSGGGQAGSSGSGGSSGALAGSGGTGSGEACPADGALRCSMQGAGQREKCVGGEWTTDEPCPTGNTCTVDAAGQPGCIAVAELCRGSGGQTVCDAQGSLVVCKADETIEAQMACPSARHCQAGSASKTCAMCLPSEEHRCTGVSLEVCAADGMSFMKKMDCETEGLCNKSLGMCTAAVCAPGKVTCDGNSLVTCNADGTEIASTKPCTGGMCDGQGGDCNMCEPGAKKCEQDMVMTCDPTGQMFVPSACPSGNKCVGLGQCVECAANADCSALTEGCKVGVCMANRCIAANAPSATACTASGGRPGTCTSGTCQCTAQCSGKECGDNGCNGTCGSCSGSQMCVDSECVQCQTDDHCSGSSNGCQRGRCQNGSCTREDVDNRLCGVGGTCMGGTCCMPQCTGKCGGANNGCGGTCTGACPSTQMCSGTTCVNRPTGDALYAPCESGSTPQGSCGPNLICTTIQGHGFNCYEAQPFQSDCPAGRDSYMGAACLRRCTDTTCPNGLVCESTWCVP